MTDPATLWDKTAPLRWLYLDLNSYFASVEQQDNPRLRGRPVAVRPAVSEYTCAIAASREAKERGVRMGTPIHEARVLCPGLIVVEARHDRYVEIHHRIIAEVWKHIPVTAVASIDELACRLMGRERAPANATAIAARVKAGIRAHVGECLTASVGLAPSKMLAKLAADMQKPDGLTVIEGRDLPGKILPLPLTDIPGVGRRMARRLEKAGIGDMRGLWNTAPKQARRIWNSVEGERLWYALHGFDLPEREPQPRHSIGHSHVLAKAMRNLDAARMVARRLLMKCGSRLRRYGEAAGTLVLHMDYETPPGVNRWEGEGWSQELRFNHTQDSFELIARFETLWMQLRRDAAARPSRPMTVGVVLQGLKSADKVARDLFADMESDPAARAQNLKLSAALDVLNKKFGRDAVSLGLMPGKLPDYMGAKVAFNRIPERAEFLE